MPPTSALCRHAERVGFQRKARQDVATRAAPPPPRQIQCEAVRACVGMGPSLQRRTPGMTVIERGRHPVGLLVGWVKLGKFRPGRAALACLLAGWQPWQLAARLAGLLVQGVAMRGQPQPQYAVLEPRPKQTGAELGAVFGRFRCLSAWLVSRLAGWFAAWLADADGRLRLAGSRCLSRRRLKRQRQLEQRS